MVAALLEVINVADDDDDADDEAGNSRLGGCCAAYCTKALSNRPANSL